MDIFIYALLGMIGYALWEILDELKKLNARKEDKQ